MLSESSLSTPFPAAPVTEADAQSKICSSSSSSSLTSDSSGNRRLGDAFGSGISLTPLLKSKAVPFSVLYERYSCLLELVRKLIGVIPNCDQYLEIWPPATRTYNIMVPNFLNFPLMLWGLAAPPQSIGLGMYIASRVAACSYCTAHTCSFALRRGAKANVLAQAIDMLYEQKETSLSAGERAVVSLAVGLAQVPATITAVHRRDMEAAFGKGNAEWHMLGIAMMGFLTKFMDAVGVELEGSCVEEVSSLLPSGWFVGKHTNGGANGTRPPPAVDTFATKVSIIRYGPAAISLDKKWTSGIPESWPAVGKALKEAIGHDWPVLSHMSHGRAIRGVAAMLRENFDPKLSVLGIPRKLLAGVIFARTVGNAQLESEILKFGTPQADDCVECFAKAIAPSPTEITETVFEKVKSLTPEEIVELVTFVAVLQMVHRIETFYAAT